MCEFVAETRSERDAGEPCYERHDAAPAVAPEAEGVDAAFAGLWAELLRGDPARPIETAASVRPLPDGYLVSVDLPIDVDATHALASLSDGRLTIRLPRRGRRG
ncbi:MAG TPA: Hsp20/alpha crystallin family protein [Caulobacteraceae bacterium]|nr:Hsp20/alpha crystallin family protein [Caulobacteraceae bacterium]